MPALLLPLLPRRGPVLLLRRLVGLLAASAIVLSVGLATTTTTASAAEPVAYDFPAFPRSCVTPPATVPQRALQCRLTPKIKGAPTLVLWGDSQAMQMIPAITQAMSGRRVNLVAFVFGACPPTDPKLKTRAQRRAAGECALTGHKATRFVTKQTKRGNDIRVIVGGFWELYHHLKTRGTVPLQGHDVRGLQRVRELSVKGIPRLFRTLSRLRVPTDVIGQSPFVPAQPPPCEAGQNPFRCTLPRGLVLKHEAGNNRRLRSWMSGLSGRPSLLQISNAFCSPQTCQGVVNGVNTFADHAHISASRAAMMGRYFRPTVTKLLRRAR